MWLFQAQKWASAAATVATAATATIIETKSNRIGSADQIQLEMILMSFNKNVIESHL